MLYADFIAVFPEFANTSVYPTARVNFWLSIAVNQINTDRWGALSNQGQALLTAHYLTIDAQNQNLAPGRTVGEVDGLETASAVDGVSASTDVASITIVGAALYNKTTYGIQFWQLACMIGAGGFQL